MMCQRFFYSAWLLALTSAGCSIDWGAGSTKKQTDAAPPTEVDGDVADSGPTDGARPDGQVMEEGGPQPCAAGLQRVDGECVDQDECALTLDDCDQSPRACVNTTPTSGSPYLCTCPSGFRGDGRGPNGCEDINECADKPCAEGVFCSNVFGTFSCGQCPPGHTGGGSEPCVDIDECADNNGGCGPKAYFRCENRVGDSPVCADIDECAVDNGGCGSPTFVRCENKLGEGPTCTDIDECAVNNGGCGPSAYVRCENNDGAVPTCVDINECSAITPYCDTSPMATCTNVIGGSATCACPDLYLGTGIGANGCTPVSCATYGGCSADYPCADQSPGVVCKGQFPDWSLESLPSRFTTNTTTVADAMTGLVWQRLTYASTGACGTDGACSLLGTTCGSDASCTPQEARTYCTNLVLDGHSDWRLPSRTELISILDFTRFEPAMDPVAFPGDNGGWFWTTSNLGGGSLFYRVDTAYGDSNLDDSTAAHRVRCVR